MNQENQVLGLEPDNPAENDLIQEQMGDNNEVGGIAGVGHGAAGGGAAGGGATVDGAAGGGAALGGVRLKMPSTKAGQLTKAFNRLIDMKRQGNAEAIVIAALQDVENELEELQALLDNIVPMSEEQKDQKEQWIAKNVSKKVAFVHRLRKALTDDEDRVSLGSRRTAASSIVKAVAHAEEEEAQLLLQQKHLKRAQEWRRQQEEEARKQRDQQEQEELERQLHGVRVRRAALAGSRPESSMGLARSEPKLGLPLSDLARQSSIEDWIERSAGEQHPWRQDEHQHRHQDTQLRVGDSVGTIQDELLQHVLLAQAKLPVFEGNTLEYLWFRASFEEQVARVTRDPTRRLHLLLQQLKGPPHQLVKGCLLMDPLVAYNRAITKLDNKYGRPVSQALAFRSQLLSWSPVHNAQELEAFSIQLQLCLDIKLSGNSLHELDSPSTLLQLASKLPHKLQVSWQARAYDMETSQGTVAGFTDFANFVERQAGLRNHPVYKKLGGERSDERKGKFRGEAFDAPATKTFSTAVQEARPSAPLGSRPKDQEMEERASRSDNGKYAKEVKVDIDAEPCLFCKGSHPTRKCGDATSIDLDFRREALKGLCFGCLRPGHRARYCRNKEQCSKCGGRHPDILHNERKASAKQDGTKEENTATEKKTSAAKKGESSYATAESSRFAIATAPVRVKLPGGHETTTLALLNPASMTTFASAALSKRLQEGRCALQAHTRELQVTTMTSQSETMTVGLLNGLALTDLERNCKIDVPAAYVVDRLPFEGDAVDPVVAQKWPHLSDIAFQWIPDGRIKLLLGLNASLALWPLQTVHGKPGEPFATRSILGWSLQGPLEECEPGSECSLVTKESRIEAQLEQIHSQDLEGLYDFTTKGPSKEDEEWKEKVNVSITKVRKKDGGCQYMVHLPFRDGAEHLLANNKQQARQRLTTLKRKFERDSQYAEDYREFMTKMIEKGFMERAPDRLDNRPTHYVLHHGVYHPKKPNKIRIVFNCANKYHGVSLNDCLLPGPDLANSLLGVLLHFRQGPVAFMADIDSMFYNVLVPEEQRDVLRLLWFDDDGQAAAYRLRVHLFGACSSPSIANFALRRAAVDADAPAEARNTILHNFYVDDCLKSTSSVGEGIAVAHGLIKACQSGGFNLSKFVSNNPTLLRALPADRLSKNLNNIDINHSLETLQERALGVTWDVRRDVFRFKIHKSPTQQTFTRREVLSSLSALYDPLGMASPVIICARLIFRKLTQTGKSKQSINWDEHLSAEQSEVGRKWIQWTQQLPDLESVTIPRCFWSALETNWQLHVFCDASQEAYAAVAYLRGVQKGNTTFVLGKARVAPIKAVTIPRLELLAAKLGTELATTIHKELQYDILERVFWTDSETVLKYLNNRTRRFHTFVANRVSAILAASVPAEWRYVPTRFNPADEGTRGVEAGQLTKCRWIKGPEFLSNLPEEWPKPAYQELAVAEDDPEVKKETTVLFTREEEDTLDVIVNWCSSMHKVRKMAAIWLRLKCHLKERRHMKRGPFDWPERQNAERAIIKWAQRRAWPQESAMPDGSLRLKRASPLFTASPLLRQGMIYLESRVKQRLLPILPKGRLAELIVREAHCEQLHFGRQFTAAAVRRRYWILGLNVLVRKVTRECSACQIRKASPMSTKMAPLPCERTTPLRPFEVTGVDYFGPFVLASQDESKGYGVIFTCATSRAVHLEAAEDLSTSSFINVLRRFIARRGNVSQLISDNGTNFRGADCCLNKELCKLKKKHKNDAAIQQELCARKIEWSFNVPGASHHGGFWERLVRSVRQALSFVSTRDPPLTFSSLNTLLCECEAVLNNRPLTCVSPDASDLEPLTPNHLLLGRNQDAIVLPPPR